jgi:hypothetical protein
VALARAADAEQVAAGAIARYGAETGLEPRLFRCRAAAGAGRMAA